jgi:hypothetical protein
VTGITADRSRIPRPLYPLSFLLVILVCYGVFVAYPSNGAVYAVTLIGNALTAGWYPVMWYAIHNLIYPYVISNPTIGPGEYKPPPELLAPPFLLGLSTATGKLEVPLARNCSEASMPHIIQFHLLLLWAWLVSVLF